MRIFLILGTLVFLGWYAFHSLVSGGGGSFIGSSIKSMSEVTTKTLTPRSQTQAPLEGHSGLSVSGPLKVSDGGFAPAKAPEGRDPSEPFRVTHLYRLQRFAKTYRSRPRIPMIAQQGCR